MEINNEDLKKVIEVRQHLIDAHGRCKDYKNNKNAIMREIDHVAVLESSIKKIDAFLTKYVQFV